MLEAGIEIALFVIAVASVGSGFVLSRRMRNQPASAPKPISRSVLGGWMLFVILNVAGGLTHPLIACKLFLRAYVIRAAFLRKTLFWKRKKPEPTKAG